MAASSASLPQWAYALGAPAARARIKTCPDDFVVIEELDFAASGDGEHMLLLIEKTGLNTATVAGMLAAHAGVRPSAVSFSGMKDRQARTRQWFSVHLPGRAAPDWRNLGAEGVRLLEAHRHARKLRRGSHRSNLFRIVLRDLQDGDGSLQERLPELRTSGAPNFFGEQRFGRDGGNVALAAAMFSGRRLPRARRSLALSAARSLIFNELLSARVECGNWNRLEAGDVAGLDGTRSIFPVHAVDDALAARVLRLDVHPTGPLWGRGTPATRPPVSDLESAVAARHADLADGLTVHTRAGRRALRMRIDALDWSLSPGTATLTFRLAAGSYATSVLRELVGPR